MNNEFIPFEQALALKELGFNEPCFMQWTYAPELIFCVDNWGNPKFKTNKESYSDSAGDYISAPLYQQAFRWFREKYRISPIITCYSELGNAWKYHIPNEDGEQGFNTYEQAELACLIKLIEICKNK